MNVVFVIFFFVNILIFKFITCGEKGIRTLGTNKYVQQISNLPLSTTQPSLHFFCNLALAGLEPATLGL